MKIKVAEATPLQLDWLVAKCEDILDIYYDEESDTNLLPQTETVYFHPSTDWAQGGPIIEREKTDLIFDPNGTAGWGARIYVAPLEPIWQYGPTPLLAAMRCYVASKMGDEVEIPEELK